MTTTPPPVVSNPSPYLGLSEFLQQPSPLPRALSSLSPRTPRTTLTNASPGLPHSPSTNELLPLTGNMPQGSPLEHPALHGGSPDLPASVSLFTTLSQRLIAIFDRFLAVIRLPQGKEATPSPTTPHPTRRPPSQNFDPTVLLTNHKPEGAQNPKPLRISSENLGGGENKPPDIFQANNTRRANAGSLRISGEDLQGRTSPETPTRHAPPEGHKLLFVGEQRTRSFSGGSTTTTATTAQTILSSLSLNPMSPTPSSFDDSTPNSPNHSFKPTHTGSSSSTPPNTPNKNLTPFQLSETQVQNKTSIKHSKPPPVILPEIYEKTPEPR